ncbi:MAG: RNA polymerase sigma factor [Nannocystaceae bacterium]
MRADMELLHAWREGDEHAGRELFARHFDSVFRFFRNKVDGVADDLTQQTFLGCLRGREKFRGEASFRTYVFSIARKRLYTHYRDQQRKGVNLDFDQASVADLAGLSPTAMIAERQEQRLLLRALRQLPLDMQIALELHYWEDLKVREIAEILDVPSGTIKRRLQRARQQLERNLAAASESPALLKSTLDNFSHWAGGLRKQLVPPS